MSEQKTITRLLMDLRRHLTFEMTLEKLLDLDEALDKLAGLNGRQAQVVECRFFGGWRTCG